MRVRHLLAVAGFASCAISIVAGGQEQRIPPFRAAANMVVLTVSVRASGEPVRGLTIEDFEVRDDGVRQPLDYAGVIDSPLDVTMVADAGFLAESSTERTGAVVDAIGRLLDHDDRLRVLTAADSVQELVPWQPAGMPARVASLRGAGGASTMDAVLLAFSPPGTPGRRHLVVAMTSGRGDLASATEPAMLPTAAARGDAVLHVVLAPPDWFHRAFEVANVTATVSPPLAGDYLRMLELAAGRAPPLVGLLAETALVTGGAVFEPTIDVPDVARAFRSVLEDFRAGYLLAYAMPTVRRAGWRTIEVKVQGRPGAVVRARRGYFAR